MAQRISGLYRLVAVPRFYNGLALLLGAASARRRFVAELVKPASGMRILDCGCGPAAMLNYLPDVDYTGIDLNPKHIAYARVLHGNRGHFIAGDATSEVAELTPGFDIVLVSALLHHLDDAQAARLLSIVLRATLIGGRVVTLDSVRLPGQNPIVRLLNALDSGRNVRTEEGYLRLVEGLPAHVETRLYRDLLSVPYDHFCMSLTRLY